MYNIKEEMLKIYNEKQKYNESYNNKLSSFLTKAYELVDLSNDLYQVENTIKLNKISLKDYLLNSPICLKLKDNNINEYNIDELKQYMIDYEIQNSFDITQYILALELYEELEELENIENNKINYEISKLSNILTDINNIKNSHKEQYEIIYNKLINLLKEQYLNYNYIDDITYNYTIEILNDIFYYFNGLKGNIPN